MEADMGKRFEWSGRGSKTGETERVRGYGFHADQKEIIQLALEKARKESETEYDSVALTNICLGYIAGK
jgi:hypothetical protein